MTDIEKARKRAASDAESRGYFLNPDTEFVDMLLEGIVENEKRHGYPACPCRLSSGNFDVDRDIVCPCDYRDVDVEEFGYCYCALFVRKDVVDGLNQVQPIPERRNLDKFEAAFDGKPKTEKSSSGSKKAASETKNRLWYCKQCGYVAFREEPPNICPVCKAKREFFAEIVMPGKLSVR